MTMPKKKEDPIPEMTPVEQVLADAQGSDDVIVISINDGEIEILSSVTYPPDILWSLEMAKSHTLELGESGTEQ
jgi:hypothetical protein